MSAVRLALLHLHQRRAPLDARERLSAIHAGALPGPDLIGLLTCHRVELYAAVSRSRDPLEAFADRLGSRDGVLREAAILVDMDAAAHLFRVAAGLDSVIVGEGQIVGQLRRTYDAARASGLDPALAALCQRALHLGRTLRATTALGAVRRSIGSLAVDEALGQLEEPSRAIALVVGAGEIGKLAARALARRVGCLLIANRDAARAAEVAAAVGAEAVAFSALADALARCDVAISAADTRGTLLTRELLASRAAQGPLVLVDIAVPRSVPEDARDLPGLVYRDVDHLATDASPVPADVVADAERKCADEARSFVAWLDERASTGTIRALRERADAIRDRQLARALRHLRHLSDRDREVVAALAASLTHALLHEPTVRLRRAPETEPAARTLFGIER